MQSLFLLTTFPVSGSAAFQFATENLPQNLPKAVVVPLDSTTQASTNKIATAHVYSEYPVPSAPAAPETVHAYAEALPARRSTPGLRSAGIRKSVLGQYVEKLRKQNLAAHPAGHMPKITSVEPHIGTVSAPGIFWGGSQESLGLYTAIFEDGTRSRPFRYSALKRIYRSFSVAQEEEAASQYDHNGPFGALVHHLRAFPGSSGKNLSTKNLHYRAAGFVPVLNDMRALMTETYIPGSAVSSFDALLRGPRVTCAPVRARVATKGRRGRRRTHIPRRVWGFGGN